MNFLRASRDWIAGITRLIPTWARVTTILLFILMVTGGLAVYIWDWLQSAGSGLEESNSTTQPGVALRNPTAQLSGISGFFSGASSP